MSSPLARCSFLRAMVAWGALLIAAGVLAAGPRPMSASPAAQTSHASGQDLPVVQETQPSSEPRLPRKQRQELLKSNLDKMRRDADDMADLTKSLQEDLRKANQNVFSLTIVQRAEKIEKLARRIKETARGY